MTSAAESYDRPNGSNIAAEDIAPHELIIDNVGTGVELVDGDESVWDGIALALESGAWTHDNEYDTDSLEYHSADNDRVDYAHREDGMIIRPVTIIDSGNGESAPSISEGDVVGVPNSTVGDGETEWSGRVVQEGYSNGGTTFNRTNSNFIPVGVADVQHKQETVDGFDEQVRVRVHTDL